MFTTLKIIALPFIAGIRHRNSLISSAGINKMRFSKSLSARWQCNRKAGFFIFYALLGAMLQPDNAHARCRADYDAIPFRSLLSITQPLEFDNASYRVNDVIRTDDLTVDNGANAIWCENSTYNMDTVGREGANNRTLYNTSIPGLTLGIFWVNIGGAGPRSMTHNGNMQAISPGLLQRPYRMPSGTLRVEWIKTGEIMPVSTNPLPNGLIASVRQGGRLFQIIILDGPGVTVRTSVPPTCNPSANSFGVPLGNRLITRFTGMGSTTPPQPFELVLNCGGGDAGTQVAAWVTLSDANNRSNTSDRLTLTPGSTVQGVGVQVLRNGRPLRFGANAPGNPWNAGQMQGASGFRQLRIPLAARYVQTADTVTSVGRADARATFTINYQ